ncbi:FdhF/YdeP family oxidoreductase [Dermacoccaceae bacterium W4C1]
MQELIQMTDTNARPHPSDMESVPPPPTQPVTNRDGAQGLGGYGPVNTGSFSRKDYHHPAAAWGAAVSVGQVLAKSREPISGTKAMFTMNQPTKGFDCPGCAWPDDTRGLTLDICENGIKHVTWEMTRKEVGPAFFAAHTVTELQSWTDYDLEAQGRLTEPMVYDAESDTYQPISWEDAFALVGRHLRQLKSADEATFYTSGRLSNEATFLYQLWVREFGTNNLPDCSNMCHEASGRALTASLGTGKGTADLTDWEEAEALFIMGNNAGTNAPRMLTSLAEAFDRGAQVVHVNPLLEAASRGTIVPHEILDMARNKVTQTSTMNLQVRPGGDMALIRGMAKVVFEKQDETGDVLDADFLSTYTHEMAAYRELVEATDWSTLITQSGLSEEQIRGAAQVYLDSKRTIISWCLGVSQHEHGVDTVREIVNLLMLKGNLGRIGAGPSPVRGHSNVQGNRTCGVNHRPTEAFLQRLDEVCGITSPRHHGLDTVKTMEAMNSGAVKVFVGMGGNFVLAAPDTAYTSQGLRECELTVQVSTKLNRSHLVHGKDALILPCLGRSEKDMQAAGRQSVSAEDAMSMVQLSSGKRRPVSAHLKSEPAIIAGMAQASLTETVTPWQEYVDDYDRIRDTMAKVLPGFEDFNTRVRGRIGFRIAQPARELTFVTPSGKAEFSLAELPNVVPSDPEVLVLQTMRSHDQWNTTIYSDNDRYRGVKGIRTLIFMHPEDMAARGLEEGAAVDIISTSRDGSVRRLENYRALAYDLPKGSAAGYMPEMNVLIGRADFSKQSDQPLMKHINVKVVPAGQGR